MTSGNTVVDFIFFGLGLFALYATINSLLFQVDTSEAGLLHEMHMRSHERSREAQTAWNLTMHGAM